MTPGRLRERDRKFWSRLGSETTTHHMAGAPALLRARLQRLGPCMHCPPSCSHSFMAETLFTHEELELPSGGVRGRVTRDGEKPVPDTPRVGADTALELGRTLARQGGPDPCLVQAIGHAGRQAETEPSVPRRPCGTVELAAAACGAALTLV